LRDGLQIIDDAKETQSLAEQADPEQSVVIVPAFTGLGAPYWDADCRGAIYGLTRNSGPKEFAKAALQSVAFQTRDLLEAMRKDWASDADTILRVDGGMAASEWTMQYLSDQLNAAVDRPLVTETTAKGAAYLAGLAIGLYPEPQEFKKTWQLEKRFVPSLNSKNREKDYEQWLDAVNRTLSK
jgi:glycerol kinase